MAHILTITAVTPRERSTRSMPTCGSILSIRDIALYFLAEARISLGQFDAAVAALKQRLERNPNSETSYALLASCYGHLGRIAESSGSLGGGHENCSGFFNRAAAAHPAVQKSR